MVRLIFVNLLLLVAGCASLQTEVSKDPGRIDSLTVGRFTTRDPVDNELIGSYLRKELSKRGFRVVDDSPYCLSGAIDVDPFYLWIAEARIVLGKNSAEQIVWCYEERNLFKAKTRKQFAAYMAEKIKERLR